jgi:hypothetical protein
MSPTDGQSGDLEPAVVRRRGFYAGLIGFLILLAGGVALRAYYAVRYTEHAAWPTLEWVIWLFVFSLGGGVVVGTVVTAWRLVNRKPKQPRWGVGLIVLVIVLFGFLVWPTPWSYRQYGCDVLQINRFIGRVSVIAKIPACEATSVAGTTPN